MAKKDDWVVTVKDEMERMDSIQTVEKQHWDKRSIYKVPAFVTDLNMKAYKPQSVSFGPYHHGEHHLAPMEKHKHRALLHFLKRSSKPIESYIRSLAEVTQILKDSYESLDLAWERDTERFLQMMIVDGCFMIEVLRNFTNTSNDYADNDPIFSNHGKLLIVPYIRRDMLMLENQLPMLLLTTLLDEETKREITERHTMGKKMELLGERRTTWPFRASMAKREEEKVRWQPEEASIKVIMLWWAQDEMKVVTSRESLEGRAMGLRFYS
ncbi:hypothetical protein RHGRI_034392 [Rhododendron griersonianum]|uniref:Uncharacterized protein n=1 Tax=Rhododendron griersonianum TaxID=479676 RepID=A0AAV6I0H6_9ERIC|nr:hypothetical protein RHGRI_034392 [Rhododendron griersonianum]